MGKKGRMAFRDMCDDIHSWKKGLTISAGSYLHGSQASWHWHYATGTSCSLPSSLVSLSDCISLVTSSLGPHKNIQTLQGTFVFRRDPYSLGPPSTAAVVLMAVCLDALSVDAGEEQTYWAFTGFTKARLWLNRFKVPGEVHYLIQKRQQTADNR